MSDNLLLDTHILLWVLLEPSKIPEDIKKPIDVAQQSNRLLISSISLWEIAMLASKQRINVFKPITDFLASIENIRGLNIIPLNANVAAESVILPGDFHNDPADRIIVASARCHSAILITRDQKILTWASSGHIKSLLV